MIGDAILTLFSGVSNLFLGLLPLGAILTGFTIQAGWIWGYDVLNAYLPIAEILIAVTVLLTLRMTMIAVRAMVFVKSLIPFA